MLLRYKMPFCFHTEKYWRGISIAEGRTKMFNGRQAFCASLSFATVTKLNVKLRERFYYLILDVILIDLFF